MPVSKQTRPLIYIVGALAVLWALGAWLERHPVQQVAVSTRPTVPHGSIIGSMVLGCPSASGLTELDKYRALGYEDSYRVLRGACYSFSAGDRVTIVDTDDFTRTVKIHKSGDFFDYWVHSYDLVTQ